MYAYIGVTSKLVFAVSIIKLLGHFLVQFGPADLVLCYTQSTGVFFVLFSACLWRVYHMVSNPKKQISLFIDDFLSILFILIILFQLFQLF